MDWIQILTLCGSHIVSITALISMFLWARSEARQDQLELRAISRSIELEIRDFHSRLIEIERKRK